MEQGIEVIISLLFLIEVRCWKIEYGFTWNIYGRSSGELKHRIWIEDSDLFAFPIEDGASQTCSLEGREYRDDWWNEDVNQIIELRTNGFVVWSTFITLESKPVLNFNQHVRLLNKDCYVHGYIVPHGGSVNEFLSFYICPTTHLSRAMMMMMRHCDSVVVTFTSYRWYRALLSPLLVFK